MLRNGVAMAALVGKPVRVVNIRAGRSTPGLRQQHLTGLNLVAKMTGSALKGAQVKAGTIEFVPGRGRDGGEFVADAKTAGSTMLLLQVALPCMIFRTAPVAVSLRGGTDAAFAPLYGYAAAVLAPTLDRMFGVRVGLELRRRGWFPRGGGEVVARAEPVRGALPAAEAVVRGDLKRLTARVLLSGKMPRRLVRPVVDSLRAGLGEAVLGLGVELEVDAAPEPREVASHDAGMSVLLVAETTEGRVLAASALNSRKAKPEALAEACGRELAAAWESGACVDEHMQDQLVIFMALAEGTSRILCGPLTLHTRTAIHWATVVLGASFDTEEQGGGARVLLTCRGIGYRSRFQAE